MTTMQEGWTNTRHLAFYDNLIEVYDFIYKNTINLIII